MPRREYGSGSILSTGENVWKLRWYAPPDPITGVRRRKSSTFHGSRRAAVKRLAELTGAATAGADMPFGQLHERWRASTQHAPSTARNYDLGRATLPASFLAMPIAEIRAATVAALDDLVVAKHGPHRARLVHSVVSGALTYAWRMEWIADNPARRVTVPTAPKARRRTPTSAEVRKLLEVVVDDPELYA